MPVDAFLEVFVAPPETGTAQALFDHTAQLMIFKPAGMRVTSRSGNFFVGDTVVAPVVSNVAEPAGWHMGLPSLLALLGVSRRRLRS